MPELPEVETIRRQLQSRIAHKTVREVKVLYPKVVHGMGAAEFERALAGRKVREVGRQGKLILIRLDGNETLVVHLKMTGRMILEKSRPSTTVFGLRSGNKSLSPERSAAESKGTSANKSTEVIFTFTDGDAKRPASRAQRGGTILRYDDLRRFGYMKIVPTPEEARVVQKEHLGVDFFDRALTVGKFKELIHSRGGSQIKPLLMDQSLISGIGNIYAQEAGFEARVHPTRKAGDLSDKECAALYSALHKIMKKAVKLGGTSADAYLDAFGREGKFVPHLKVYGREGKPCKRCKAKLLKKSIGGRGTVFCSKCQK